MGYRYIAQQKQISVVQKLCKCMTLNFDIDLSTKVNHTLLHLSLHTVEVLKKLMRFLFVSFLCVFTSPSVV